MTRRRPVRAAVLWLATDEDRTVGAIVINAAASLTAFAFAEPEVTLRTPVKAIEAIYFGVTTWSTTGFGDISPVTPAGQLVVCWFMVSSLLLTLALGAHFVGFIFPDLHVFTEAEQQEVRDRLVRTEEALARIETAVNALHEARRGATR